jgi:hypothetical protein
MHLLRPQHTSADLNSQMDNGVGPGWLAPDAALQILTPHTPCLLEDLPSTGQTHVEPSA